MVSHYFKWFYFYSGILSLRRFNDDDVCIWEVQFGRLDDLVEKFKMPRNPVPKRRETDLSWLDVGSPSQGREPDDQSEICSIASSEGHLRREGCSFSLFSSQIPQTVFT
jgi:hypothetical protein